MRTKKETVGTPTYSKKFTQKTKKSKSQHSIIHKHEIRLEELSIHDKKLQKIRNDIKNLEKGISCNPTTSTSSLKVPCRLTSKVPSRLTTSSLKVPSLKVPSRLTTSSLKVVDEKEDKTKRLLRNLKNEKNKLENNGNLCDYLLDSTRIIQKYIELENRESELLNLNELSEEISLMNKNVI